MKAAHTAALLLCAAITSCSPAGAGPSTDDHPPSSANAGQTVTEQSPGVYLSVGDESAGERMDAVLLYVPAPGNGGRVAEVHLKYSEAMRFVSASPGTALIAADKDLTVQDKGGVLRVVAFSPSNTHELARGTLATLHFERTGAGITRVEIAADKPLFAPAAANQGLAIGPALDL